jgi:hypothetical protein
VTNDYPIDSGVTISGKCIFYFKDGPVGNFIKKDTEEVDWSKAAVPSGSVLVFRPRNQEGCVMAIILRVNISGEAAPREFSLPDEPGRCLLRLPVRCVPLSG